jgi:hypothetical protein
MLKNYLYLCLSSLLLFTACDNAGTDGDDADDGEQIANIDVKKYEIPEVKACQKPTTVRELSGGMQKIFYQINKDNEVNLALFGGSGIRLGKKEMIVIVDFMQHKDLKCEDKETRYGVGVRLFLHIKKASRKMDLNDLPNLAANVQLGKASVQYIIKTIGVTGDKINNLIPRSTTNTFDVEGYAGVVNAVDRIQQLIRDDIDGVIIDPQQIPK